MHKFDKLLKPNYDEFKIIRQLDKKEIADIEKYFDISNYIVLGLAGTLSAILGSYIGFKSLKKITLNYIRNLVAVMILLIAFLLLLGVL